MDVLQMIASLTGDDVTDESRAAELAGLTDEQLAEVEAELLSHFQAIRSGEIEDVDADDLGALRTVASAVELLRTEAAARYETAATAQAEAEQRAAEAAELEASLLAEPETETEPVAEIVEEPVVETVPEPVVEPEPVLVEASAPATPRPTLAELAAVAPPRDAAPAAPAATRPRWQAIDGSPVRDWSEAAARIAAAREDFIDAPSGASDKVRVVRMSAEFPADRKISRDDRPETATKKVAALTAAAQDPATWQQAPQALVASGGWCAPLEPIYDVVQLADADRPERSGLPVIGADRGGIRHARRTGLRRIDTTGTDAGVGTWDADTDETPGESVKSRQTFSCPSIIDVELQAIYRRMRFGNFQGRAFPEAVEADLADLMAAHARLAETETLDAIIAAFNTDVTEGAVLGSSRDLLEAWGRAASAIRSEQRLRPDAMLRVHAPAWVIGMFQADIVRQQASGELDALFVTEADVRRMISGLNLNVTFYRDTPTGSAQVFGPIGDETNLINWPTTVHWLMHPEGSVAFLDGGQLDLGIVRDSTLIDTNDYEVFAETFEAAAYFGPVGISVVHTVCPNGESQVATDETATVCSAS